MTNPTVPPEKVKLLTFLERALKVGVGVVALVGSAWTGLNYFWASVANVATDGELASAVEKHNGLDGAHPKLQSRTDGVNKYAVSLDQELRAQRHQSENLGARIVRLIAADAEPNPALRAAAASYYERLYRRLVQRGATIDDAISEAIDTPWPQRPKR